MKRIAVLLGLVATVAGVAVFARPWLDLPAPPTQSIVLSMKDYTFNGSNPTLSFKPGERVRFLVTNDETTRVLHNFRIVGMDVPCGPPLLPGERREVVVEIPPSGEFAYTCCTHPGMGGKLMVAGR